MNVYDCVRHSNLLSKIFEYVMRSSAIATSTFTYTNAENLRFYGDHKVDY